MEENVLNNSVRITITRIVLVVVMSAVAGCQVNSSKDNAAANSIPPDAIEVGKDQYMVPIDSDGTKCQMYRMYSPNHAVVAAVFFKTANGKFVIDRGKADCS